MTRRCLILQAVAATEEARRCAEERERKLMADFAAQAKRVEDLEATVKKQREEADRERAEVEQVVSATRAESNKAREDMEAESRQTAAALEAERKRARVLEAEAASKEEVSTSMRRELDGAKAEVEELRRQLEELQRAKEELSSNVSTGSKQVSSLQVTGTPMDGWLLLLRDVLNLAQGTVRRWAAILLYTIGEGVGRRAGGVGIGANREILSILLRG